MSREDFRILEAVGDPEILVVQSPAIIAYNLDMTRPHVSNRLSAFTEHGLVEKIENGRYQMSDLGYAYLEGELDAEGLELNEE